MKNYYLRVFFLLTLLFPILGSIEHFKQQCLTYAPPVVVGILTFGALHTLNAAYNNISLFNFSDYKTESIISLLGMMTSAGSYAGLSYLTDNDNNTLLNRNSARPTINSNGRCAYSLRYEFEDESSKLKNKGFKIKCSDKTIRHRYSDHFFSKYCNSNHFIPIIPNCEDSEIEPHYILSIDLDYISSEVFNDFMNFLEHKACFALSKSNLEIPKEHTSSPLYCLVNDMDHDLEYMTLLHYQSILNKLAIKVDYIWGKYSKCYDIDNIILHALKNMRLDLKKLSEQYTNSLLNIAVKDGALQEIIMCNIIGTISDYDKKKHKHLINDINYALCCLDKFYQDETSKELRNTHINRLLGKIVYYIPSKQRITLKEYENLSKSNIEVARHKFGQFRMTDGTIAIPLNNKEGKWL